MPVLRECVTVADSNMMERDAKPGEALQSRVALVTGAAKRIGRAVAVRLAKEGADIVVHYRGSKDEAAEAVAEIEKIGRRAVAIQADLGDVSQIKHLIAETGKQFGRLDILVNSAANFLPASIVSTTEQVWDASLGTNTMPGDPPEWEQDFIKRAPLRRSGRPSDVAETVVFLVRSEFITGQVIVTDGGRTL